MFFEQIESLESQVDEHFMQRLTKIKQLKVRLAVYWFGEREAKPLVNDLWKCTLCVYRNQCHI